jgi:DNA invertase Pin-like site-specific DNA recombinase
VRAALRLAKSKGKRLGRPRVAFTAARVAALRAGGVPWRAVSEQLGIGVGTACRAIQSQATNM